jgi:HTH-type transcriptional regulator/antitoxin HigA
MELKVIKTRKDYQKALERLDKIFDAKKGTKEGDELELLSLIIDSYEKEHFPIDLPDPIEAIKFRMEQLGYKQRDLEDIIGYKGRVSEILNKKRKLTSSTEGSTVASGYWAWMISLTRSPDKNGWRVLGTTPGMGGTVGSPAPRSEETNCWTCARLCERNCFPRLSSVGRGAPDIWIRLSSGAQF